MDNNTYKAIPNKKATKRWLFLASSLSLFAQISLLHFFIRQQSGGIIAVSNTA